VSGSEGEIATAIYVYQWTTITIECAEPITLVAFDGSLPVDVPRDRTLRIAPGVYRVKSRAVLAVQGDFADVVTMREGDPYPPPPPQLLKAFPSMTYAALEHFFERAPPLESRILVKAQSPSLPNRPLVAGIAGFSPHSLRELQKLEDSSPWEDEDIEVVVRHRAQRRRSSLRAPAFTERDEPGSFSFRVTSGPAVRITVYDAARKVRGQSEGSVRLSLPPGLYVVLLEHGGVVHKEIVDHEHPTELAHPGPPSSSPIPLTGAASPYTTPARRLSLEDTGPPLGVPPHESRLFLFLRRARPDAEPRALPSEPITVHDVAGRPLAAISRDNARIDDELGYAALSCRVAPGTYRIRSGWSRRDLAVTIPAGRAAHVFIADAGVVRLDEVRVSLIPVDAAFDSASPIASAMESVLAALRAPDRELPSAARALLSAAEADLCFGIAAAHLLWRNHDRPAFTGVMQRLVRYREIPDIVVLEHLERLELREPSTVQLPKSPPLLHASFLAAAKGLQLGARTVDANSALAQAARTAFHDSLWCTWSARTWDERWIKPAVEQLRAQDRRSDPASIARTLALPTAIVVNALWALDATTLRANGRLLESTEMRVPGYQLRELLGRGARSTVFRATRLGDAREVALKIVPLLGGADACAHVLRELARGKRIDHPRILAPTARGALPDATGIWLELELCRGSVLDLVAESDAPMAVAEVQRRVLEALDGLAALHRRGIVHGDLNPENLLVRLDGSVAISDVGLTRCLASVKRSLGVSHAPRFAPPELLGTEARATPASDVWSMAATLHFLLTLEPPRDEYADQSQLDAARENPIVPLAARRRDVPPELARCVDGALSRDVSARPPDADAFRAQLAPRPSGPDEVRPLPKHLRLLLGIGLGLLVIGLALLIAWQLGIGGSGPVAPADAPSTTNDPLLVYAPLIDAQPPIDAPPEIDAFHQAAPPMIRVEIDSTPPNAEVLLRKQTGAFSLGTTPLRTMIFKEESPANLIVHKPDFEDFTQRIDLTRDVRVHAKLIETIETSR